MQTRRRNGLRLVLAGVALASVAACDGVGGDAPIDNGAPTPGVINIKVGGDSFSSAFPAAVYEPGTEENCDRSDQSYAARLDGQVIGSDTLEVESVACSGAKIEHMLDIKQYVLPGMVPQVEAVTAETNAFIFTMGGNDASLAEVTKACVFNRIVTACAEALAAAKANVGGFISDGIRQIIQESKARGAAGIKVVLVGYPVILPDPTAVDWAACTDVTIPGSQTPIEPALAITADEAVQISSFQRGMNDTLRQVAEAADAFYVPVDFSGHEVCTGEPYMRGLVPSDILTSLHPNDSGYDEMYEQVLAGLQRIYAQPSPFPTP